MDANTTFTPQVLGETEKALNAILYRQLDGAGPHRAPVDRPPADRDRRWRDPAPAARGAAGRGAEDRPADAEARVEELETAGLLLQSPGEVE